MRISLDEVRVTAALARLALSPGEEVEAQRALDTILSYMADLDRVDLGAPALACEPASSGGSLRADVVGAQLSVEHALAAAPRVVDGHFSVPRVISRDREGA